MIANSTHGVRQGLGDPEWFSWGRGAHVATWCWIMHGFASVEGALHVLDYVWGGGGALYLHIEEELYIAVDFTENNFLFYWQFSQFFPASFESTHNLINSIGEKQGICNVIPNLQSFRLW